MASETPVWRRFIEHATFITERLADVNARTIDEAATAIARGLVDGGGLFVFGCGHSGLVARDLFFRAGGLRCVRLISHPKVDLTWDPVAETSAYEKEEGWIEELIDAHDPGPRDTVIVISTSGVNAVPVGAAREARRCGARVVAVTSRAYDDALPPRHSSGKRLADFSDFVLDNLSPVGDTLVATQPDGAYMGSTSTIAGAWLLHALAIAIREAAAPHGNLPVYVSGNIPGGMEKNRV